MTVIDNFQWGGLCGKCVLGGASAVIYGVADRFKAVASWVNKTTERGTVWVCHVQQGAHAHTRIGAGMRLNTTTTRKAIARQPAHYRSSKVDTGSKRRW